MRIDGEWLWFADGIQRPVVHDLVQAATSQWVPARLLVDSGADRTVFAAEIAGLLGFDEATPSRLKGLEGFADAINISTCLSLTSDGGQSLTFRGQYAAVTTPDDLELSVLGRDILGWFAVIVDQPSQLVTLIRDRHSYQIVQSNS
jgi:hypothetical protein